MNRTLRAIVGAALVLVIAFSGISICQNLGRRWKVDVTDQKLYTLSDGTKAILGRLNQPIKIKFFYAKTAAMKGPDQIRYFNNYSEFVRALLDEYVAASNGMVQLQVIDPRPFSEDEEQALRLGLRRFPITEEESFFFGLAVQTQFGVEKTIPFFSPDRQNFVEYDISYLIDTAITRQKTRVGIMSSLPVMGDDVTGYMAQMMRMQGQQPKPAWTIVEHLRQKYDVTEVPTDVTDINDVDILIVIHPKDLPERTQFAIDQFVLKGGRAIVCVDPHCIVDRPQRSPMQMTAEKQSSDLDRLMRMWGLSMPANTFAGDRSLRLEAPLTANQRPQPIMGFLGLKPPCFNEEKAITADLNEVRVLFAGVLREVSPAGPMEAADPNRGDRGPDGIVRTPLIMTTEKGNSWSVSSSFELMFPDPDKLMAKFFDGTQPVPMGYLVTGRFRSAFPEGIEVEAEEAAENDDDDEPNEPRRVTKRITGLTEASADCAVAVFSDVDFLSDQMAYANSLFGRMVVGDNSALLMNTIEDLSGSGDLISIRSRGNYKRPFTVVDEIEQQAERETADEVALINAQIEGFNLELRNLVESGQAGEQEEVIGSSIIEKKRQLELKIREAQRQLREVNARRRERIEHLGSILRRFNMGLVPGVIMLVALVLGLWRSFRRRHYISHASDA
jgi:ABC-type uncharacterized transport system involved in gliding motility auxiliary subunit